MAAPKRNTNAQKWNESKVIGYLDQIETAARDRKNLFLGQVLIQLGLYKDIWRYWKQKYGHIDEVIDQMEVIEITFESNLFEAAMKSEIPAKIAIICLKNVYHWREYPDKEYERVKVVSIQADEGPETDKYRQRRA